MVKKKTQYTDTLLDPTGIELTGKLVQLYQKWFNPGQDAAQHHLRCEGGFGCHPQLSGKSVFGTFTDGEQTTIRRNDIEFIVREE